MVTHDPNAASYADRVVFLADGRVVDELTAPDRRRGPRHDEAARPVAAVGAAGGALMLRATLKSLLSRKLRLILSGLAVVLGVMFVSGAFVLTDTLGRSFNQLFDRHLRQRRRPGDRGAEAGGSRSGRRHPGRAIPADVHCGQNPGVSGVAAATGRVIVDGAHVVGSDGKIVPLGRAAPLRRRLAVARSDVDAAYQVAGRPPTTRSPSTPALAKAGRAQGRRPGRRPFTVASESTHVHTWSASSATPVARTPSAVRRWSPSPLPVAQKLMLLQSNVFSRGQREGRPRGRPTTSCVTGSRPPSAPATR